MIEPFHIGSSTEGLKLSSLFSFHSLKSVKMFLKRYKPKMDALVIDRQHSTLLENFKHPIDNYATLNGDGLVSVCILCCRRDSTVNQHEIAIYEHMTKKLKFLGKIPRHRFTHEFNEQIFVRRFDDELADTLADVEGVMGALTYNGRYVVVFAHSRQLMTMNVFDIWNMCCIFEIDCSEVEFLRCNPTGIALNPQEIPQGRFEVAIQNEKMEIRSWDATTRSERAAKLENVSSCCSGRYRYDTTIVRSRESALMFTPNGSLLCVMGYFAGENTAKCIVLVAKSLEPLCVMSYGWMCFEIYGMFPCFSSCGSKFVIFSVENNDDYWDFKKYRYLYFTIPTRMESLKDLCKTTILQYVDIAKLDKLPLSIDLITFLGGNIASSDDEMRSAMNKKRCTVV